MLYGVHDVVLVIIVDCGWLVVDVCVFVSVVCCFVCLNVVSFPTHPFLTLFACFVLVVLSM